MKIWKPSDHKTLMYYLESIEEEASDDLTDWESNFIEDIGKKLRSERTLSEKQEQILERIYAEKTK